MPWIHPNPRKRFGMEAARFVVYLTIPVVAITLCSDPKNMNTLLRGFNFVEYPPEAKKLPSGKDIVKMMEEREAKRRAARLAASRTGLDSHLAAAGAVPPPPKSHRTFVDTAKSTAPAVEASATKDVAAAPPSKSGTRWFGWFRRGGGGDTGPTSPTQKNE